MSRWERQLEEEADETRDQLEQRFAKEGDSHFTNVANVFIGWHALTVACAIIAASVAAVLLIICLLLVILKGPA